MEAGALRAPAALNRISVTAPLLRLRSDEQLVAAFRAGNEAAFGVIHDRYRQRLFAYARQMLGGSRQDAEDALQDVFLRAYSALRASDRPVSLRAWLYRVAHNRCIDHLRRPTPPAVDLFDCARKPLHDPIAEAERRDDLRRLVEDVRRLPEQQRSALLMREIDGLSYAEVGEALGVTLPAVKSLLVRARIGLVEAAEARNADCADIRNDLLDAFDRGVRAGGRARRHVRDCAGCAEYRVQLRAVRSGLTALTPAGHGLLGTAAKLLGLGGAGSAGAASAGGGAAAGGGAIAAAGGGAAAKVAAVVGCAALTAGGAVEVRDRIAAPSHPAPKSAAAGPAQSALPGRHALVVTPGPLRHRPGAASAAKPAHRTDRRVTAVVTPQVHTVVGIIGATPADTDAARRTDGLTGGATVPDEETGFGHGVDGLTPLPEPPAAGAPAPDAPPAGAQAPSGPAPAGTPAPGGAAAADASTPPPGGTPPPTAAPGPGR